MRALDLRYPGQVDAAVNQVLKQHKPRDSVQGAAGGSDSDSVGQLPSRQQQMPSAEQAARLQTFMAAALSGTTHTPLGDTGCTLEAAVDAPAANMRIMVSSNHVHSDRNCC